MIEINFIDRQEIQRAHYRIKQRKWRALGNNLEKERARERIQNATPAGKASKQASCRKWASKNKRHRPQQQQLVYTRRWKLGAEADLIPSLLGLQKCACAICKSTHSGQRTWHADHDHTNGRLRGLLCTRCNTGLGQFRDCTANLLAALTYLQAPPVASLPENLVLDLTKEQRNQASRRRRLGILNAHLVPAVLAAQDNKCGICGTVEPGRQGWHADHEHTSGELRGVLCKCCNSGLGRFRDSCSLLSDAIHYLQSPPTDLLRWIR